MRRNIDFRYFVMSHETAKHASQKNMKPFLAPRRRKMNAQQAHFETYRQNNAQALRNEAPHDPIEAALIRYVSVPWEEVNARRALSNCITKYLGLCSLLLRAVWCRLATTTDHLSHFQASVMFIALGTESKVSSRRGSLIIMASSPPC